MRNFLRALKFCWPYRYRIALSVLFALLAAVLWGLNFTAIYPVLKILGGTTNLQEWADKSIASLQKDRIEPKKKELADLEKAHQAAANRETAVGPMPAPAEVVPDPKSAKVYELVDELLAEWDTEKEGRLPGADGRCVACGRPAESDGRKAEGGPGATTTPLTKRNTST